jgi:hypothetical protein
MTARYLPWPRRVDSGVLSFLLQSLLPIVIA